MTATITHTLENVDVLGVKLTITFPITVDSWIEDGRQYCECSTGDRPSLVEIEIPTGGVEYDLAPLDFDSLTPERRAGILLAMSDAAENIDPDEICDAFAREYGDDDGVEYGHPGDHKAGRE